MELNQIDLFHLGVKALIVSLDREVLILERYHPIKGSYWDLPGGRLHKGETQPETLRREVEEETGLREIGEIQPFMLLPTSIRIKDNKTDVGLIFSVFLVTVPEPFQPILSDEHTAFKWCSLLSASEKLKANYTPEFIQKIMNLTSAN